MLSRKTFSRRTLAVVAALLLSGAGSAAYAAELGAASIVHEQQQNARALAEQKQYLAYHEHFKGLPTPPAPTGQLPHHN
ncbi:hypothetical protein [Bosea minatitlanensis]|uniref:Uncharacterized protein n=1 Tax=Bosea minatitlanensis TaxID=128782 RepID=A0ABW0F6L7_9HYPH|nr:hypothetical protein [Bosea minatitlanensis]MCT4494411.1 hypothetical protein [Bosea minatitlanensis]